MVQVINVRDVKPIVNDYSYMNRKHLHDIEEEDTYNTQEDQRSFVIKRYQTKIDDQGVFMQMFKGSNLYHEIKGVRLHTVDPGGKGIFDDNKTFMGKTEPIVQMVHSENCKLLITTAMRKTLVENYMTVNDLKTLWLCFIKMDKKNRGFITLNHIVDYLSETTYSVVAPYLERFFSLIERAHLDRVTFDEFFPAVCAFCLFTKQEVIAFVFAMLDKDNDKNISLVDLFKFVS